MKRAVMLCGAVMSMGLMVGCMTVDVTKTSKEVFEATRPDDVEILTVVPSDRKFVEIATIATSKWLPSNTAKMHNALRAKAAPLGSQAVILSSSGIDYEGYLWATGTAIRYK